MEHDLDVPECPDFGDVVGNPGDRFQIVKALVLRDRDILAVTIEENRPRWGVRLWNAEETFHYEVFWSILDAVATYEELGGE